MTPQESSMLQDLIAKVQQTQLTEKDPEAEQLLLETLGRDRDAIYKLAQTVLVQNMALEQARAQLQQFQQQAAQPQQPARATSFLGGIFGHREQGAPPSPPQQYQQYPPAQPQYQPVPAAYAQGPMYDAPPPQYGAPAPSAASSFLRSAATTAAGVAAGAMAFEGIESLLHGGFGHGGGFGGYGGGFGGGYGAAPVEETIINNNYYDEPAGGRDNFSEHREHEASYDDRPEGHHAGLQDASYQPDDSSSFDDGLNDDFNNGDDLDSDFGGGDDDNYV